MKVGGICFIFLLFLSMFFIFSHYKKTMLKTLPFITYNAKDGEVMIENNVYALDFKDNAKVGYDKQTFMVCKDNQIGVLVESHPFYLKESQTKVDVECCTYADCTIKAGTDMACWIDWEHEGSQCVSASTIHCSSDINCPGEGEWVPDWSTHLAKRFYCKFNDEGLGYCTVGEQKPFECWEGEGCPQGTVCEDNFCVTRW